MLQRIQGAMHPCDLPSKPTLVSKSSCLRHVAFGNHKHTAAACLIAENQEGLFSCNNIVGFSLYCLSCSASVWDICTSLAKEPYGMRAIHPTPLKSISYNLLLCKSRLTLEHFIWGFAIGCSGWFRSSGGPAWFIISQQDHQVGWRDRNSSIS